MSKENANWVKDLIAHVDSVPYGDITVAVKRHKNQTTQIETNAVETVRYETSQDALASLAQVVEAMQEVGYDGSMTVTFNFKDGTIKETGYYSVRATRY